jgi:hypothetical protein
MGSDDRGGRRAPPEPGELKGVTLFRATREKAERKAKAYLELLEPAN